ncbi:phosphoenolpyruvate carboxykinase (ATP) [Alicyclobacillaceae bacterium I2511]|nr:phosphoenolpyruvate carboxykinase (ATP) [Alicyclobacillaceae bacterium I2511]
MKKLPVELVEAAIRRQEAVLLANGSIDAQTGKFTGRSPHDKYFVDFPDCPLPHSMHQWLSEQQFEQLLVRVRQHLEEKGSFLFDGAVNQHPEYRVPVRFYTEYAWHNLFVQRLFLAGKEGEVPAYTVYVAPTLMASPDRDGTRSGTFIVLHTGRRIALIGGTQYAGEIKKSIFSLMHHHLTEQRVLPMHCSASMGEQGDVSLFFGLSGTGKTTLSADPVRRLIGDDEHGWSDKGVFNMENGCYAKCIDLSVKKEPDIYNAIRFGTVLENVGYDGLRNPLFEDRTLTENTRAAYPLKFIRNRVPEGHGGHPTAIVFLSADATGVLPAVARLSPEDARRHYLLGYTSKVAGTERGIVEPEATFSACFGSPFLTERPVQYADMLMERLERYKVPVYLLNTGWVGGGYGEIARIPLTITRQLVHLALSGVLETLPSYRDEELFITVPEHVPGIPDPFLRPATSFADGQVYQHRHQQLAQAFADKLIALGATVASLNKVLE